ncbi:MAG: putative colanic acid biosynthesis acetyltransferase [Thermoanaerobaculia bacterium]|jgi:putative colanic acid biosynthesis acetyltransferase WcaF
MDIKANRASTKYTQREQLLRLLWCFSSLLFQLSPRPLFGFRRALLRLFGARVGRAVNVYPSAVVVMPWNLEIGDFSSVGENALVYNLGKVTIGAQATISQRAHLCAGTHDYCDPAMPLLKPPITIGDQAWICADAFVGPGVAVGEGAVVGARAVAVKDVEPWSVVVGNPSRKVGVRKLR